MNLSGSLSWISIWDFLRELFSPRTPALPPSNPPDTTTPARIITSRLLLVIFDPIMDASSGLKLSQFMHWNRPEDLVSSFIQDILQASGGLARYQVVERLELNEFPVLLDGFRYTPMDYIDVIRKAQPAHTPPMANYQSILNQLNILARIASGGIDEVWFFGFPYAGFYESAMGGAGAFWCNAPPLAGTGNCPRRFVVMGFSYERGLGEMLEAFGHRSESILKKTFSRTSASTNLYNKFSRYDKEAPGQAQVGTIHFAPNSQADYDWNNPRIVPSGCDDWYEFPALKGTVRQVNATEWGSGDTRLHHLWWLKHLPHVAGSSNGIANNWWQYILDPNLVMP